MLQLTPGQFLYDHCTLCCSMLESSRRHDTTLLTLSSSHCGPIFWCVLAASQKCCSTLRFFTQSANLPDESSDERQDIYSSLIYRFFSEFSVVLVEKQIRSCSAIDVNEVPCLFHVRSCPRLSRARNPSLLGCPGHSRLRVECWLMHQMLPLPTKQMTRQV